MDYSLGGAEGWRVGTMDAEQHSLRATGSIDRNASFFPISYFFRMLVRSRRQIFLASGSPSYNAQCSLLIIPPYCLFIPPSRLLYPHPAHLYLASASNIEHPYFIVDLTVWFLCRHFSIILISLSLFILLPRRPHLPPFRSLSLYTRIYD